MSITVEVRGGNLEKAMRVLKKKVMKELLLLHTIMVKNWNSNNPQKKKKGMYEFLLSNRTYYNLIYQNSYSDNKKN